MSESGQRFVGIDLHKAYIMIGAVDASKQVILPPRRVALTEFDAWAKRHLGSSDQVVLEATSNAWSFTTC